MSAIRILVVDDESTITTLLPKVLALHGYEVGTASSVVEAVSIITSGEKFDVLISDLNMGHMADGFTVVHTMRRVNPDCVNFILTGYPGFESALQALRAQVDDYLVKPSDIPKLLDAIETKLNTRTRAIPKPIQRLSDLLRNNVDEIVSRVLLNMKANPDLAALPLSDEERAGYIPRMITELAAHLDTGLPNEASEGLLSTARRMGEVRAKQQCPIGLMIQNMRILAQVVNNLIYENLLAVNLSYLLLDLNKLNDAMLMQLQESVDAYLKVVRKR